MFRYLWGLLDPTSESEDEYLIWSHFSSQCAFCSIEVSKEERTYRLDHAVSKQGGGNHLGNMLLTCDPCNSTKRDLPWLDFLRDRTGLNEVEFQNRKVKIERWLAEDRGRVHVSDEALQAFEQSKSRINGVIAEEVTKLKKFSSSAK